MMQNGSDICADPTNKSGDVCVTNVNTVVMQSCDSGKIMHYFRILFRGYFSNGVAYEWASVGILLIVIVLWNPLDVNCPDFVLLIESL